MKFIHTADWHLGKLVHGIHMTEEQSYLLEQFIALAAEEKPDAVVIAGDLYDRSVPPITAVELLHHLFYTLTTELEIPILAISGNHDSAERIHFGNQLFRKSHLYIEGKPQKNPRPIEINGTHFYLLPYAEPATIRNLLADEAVVSHEDALKRTIDTIARSLDPSYRNVFVGHAFVQGGLSTDSERSLSVGGSELVNADIFAPFHYTALGHLHNPNAINHPNVFYSGSLMKYSFSEASQIKSVSIVEIDDHGNAAVTRKRLKPKRDMRIIEGYLEELLDCSFYQSQQVEDYLKIVLLDQGALLDPIGKLRSVYPNVLQLEQKELHRKMINKQLPAIAHSEKNIVQLFENFYQEMTSTSFTDEHGQLLTEIMQAIEENEKGACK